MSIQIGNIPFNEGMVNRALSYIYADPLTVARNGMGEDRTAGGATVQWTWAVLTRDEYSWLTNTLLGGFASRTFDVPGGTVLYDDEGNELTFSYGIARRPVAKDFNGIYHQDVTLIIDTLFP
jgi:hypothetical protein